jgi:hypothetical protein
MTHLLFGAILRGTLRGHLRMTGIAFLVIARLDRAIQ